MTDPAAPTTPDIPTTDAGKALVEWASRAYPNQIDTWREHAVLIETEARAIPAEPLAHDLDEVKRQNVAEVLSRQAMQRDHPERLILADALGDLMQYEHPDKYAAAFGLLSRLSADGVTLAAGPTPAEPLTSTQTSELTLALGDALRSMERIRRRASLAWGPDIVTVAEIHDVERSLRDALSSSTVAEPLRSPESDR